MLAEQPGSTMQGERQGGDCEGGHKSDLLSALNQTLAAATAA
jgi:hypothetical protein